MHIAETTHEQSATARVYTFSADYDQVGDELRWRANVHQGDEAPVPLSGTLSLSSPASAVVGEEAVRDAVVRAIDALQPRD